MFFVFDIWIVKDLYEGKEFKFTCIDGTLPILITNTPVTDALSDVGFITAINPRAVNPDSTTQRELHKLHKTFNFTHSKYSTEQCLLHEISMNVTQSLKCASL